MARAALESGKHVLVEKPLALSLREAEGVLQVAQKARRVLKCGFNHRHFPGIVQAKAWCDQGRLGRLLHVRSRHGICGRSGYEKEWRFKKELAGGGELMDQGLHTLDLARHFLGNFSEVYGKTFTAYWKADVEDNVFALMKTPGQTTAQIHASWTEWRNIFSFEVCGSEAMAVVEGLGGSYGVHRAKLVRRAWEGPFVEESLEYPGPDRSWKGEWEAFTSAMGSGSPGDGLPGSGEDGVEAMRLVEAIYESSRTGKAVQLKGMR